MERSLVWESGNMDNPGSETSWDRSRMMRVKETRASFPLLINLFN